MHEDLNTAPQRNFHKVRKATRHVAPQAKMMRTEQETHQQAKRGAESCLLSYTGQIDKNCAQQNPENWNVPTDCAHSNHMQGARDSPTEFNAPLP